MKSIRVLLAVVLLALTAMGVHASGGITIQKPDLDPSAPDPNPSVPTVTFTFEFAGTVPSHYVIMIESGGRAAYSSDSFQQEVSQYRTPSGRPEGDSYVARFTVSQATRERLFALAEKLNYFQGDYDFKKNRIANTGVKTLIYAGPQRHSQTTYNWSQDEKIQEVTKLFQDLSNTLEYGRRLEHEHHYTKLALDGELKNMEEAARNGNLSEVQAVAAILTKISNDSSVMHVARLRAQRLLAKLSGPVQESKQ
jgi:hypothetical protein